MDIPRSSYVAIDEAGIEYNSRAYKAMPKPTIAWLKKHRHYVTDIDVFSQSWEDMDVTIRRLSNQLWYMYKIGPWTLCRRVYKRVTVDKNTEQIIDGYKMASMLWLLVWPLQLGFPFDKKFMLTFRPFYYKYFDSWSVDNIPVKEFPIACPIPERKQKIILLRSFLLSRSIFPVLNRIEVKTMKRKIAICLMVVLVVVVMAVPAFADGTMASYIDDHGNVAFPVVPESGRYLCEVTYIIDDGSFTWSGVVQLNYMHEVFDDGTELFASYGIIQLVDGDHKIELNLSVMQAPITDYGGESPILCCLGTEYAVLSVVSLTLTPAQVTTENVMDSLGSFLSSSLSMLGGVLSAIANSPALLVTVVALPLGGIAVAVVSKLKNA